MKQFDKAIAAFEKALTINPLHASAEFALARSLQRMRPHRGGEGALQAFPAFDKHEDFRGDRSGLRRAGTLFDGDARLRSRRASSTR